MHTHTRAKKIYALIPSRLHTHTYTHTYTHTHTGHGEEETVEIFSDASRPPGSLLTALI